MTKLARLRARRDFLAAAQGHKYVRHGLVLQAVRRPDSDQNPQMRYGLTASKKVGHAVARNRARRRLRALAKTHIPTYGQAGFDYVLIARGATLDRPAEALAKDLETALKGVHSAPQSEREPKGKREQKRGRQ